MKFDDSIFIIPLVAILTVVPWVVGVWTIINWVV